MGSKWTAADIPDLTGRTALVTGANSGLGLRTAEGLAAAGARVLLGCRNQEKAATALEQVKAQATGPAPEIATLDLADLASVRACAEAVTASVDRLDILCNNAGVMAIPRRTTTDGFEMQFGTNHLGHFALTGLLLPALRQAPAPRVVCTSSTGHRAGRMHWDDLMFERHYRRWVVYAQSKLANLLFAFELDRRARAAGSPLIAMGAHPGYAATHLQAVGPEMAGRKVALRAMDVANKVFAQSDAMGALPQLYAATMPDVKGGEYFGPGGFMEQRGYPVRVKTTRRARNEADAARLWQVSEELTGITYDWG